MTEPMIPARAVEEARARLVVALASEHYGATERDVYEGELYRLDLLLAQAVQAEVVSQPDDETRGVE